MRHLGHEALVAERLLERRAPPAAPGRRPESTAFFVASLPVPAVVGTATNGVAGPG